MTARDVYGWGMRSAWPIAWGLSALIALGTVIGVILLLVTGQVDIAVPVEPFRPAGTGVLRGGFDRGTFTLIDAPPAVRIGSAVALAAGAALWIWVALTVATVAASVRDGAGFTPRLSRALAVLALAVLVLSAVAQVATGIAGSAASEALFPEATTSPATAPAAMVAVSLDFTPYFVALALGVLAFVFDRAARLQRDAEGLV